MAGRPIDGQSTQRLSELSGTLSWKESIGSVVLAAPSSAMPSLSSQLNRSGSERAVFLSPDFSRGNNLDFLPRDFAPALAKLSSSV
jgi:hypothetical protein